jgi:hypothetical protein
MKINELKDNTFSIVVPKGIRYLSNWKEFTLFNFPHIIDKQIPGCGFTEFCLTNDQDVVLCSPRKLLLENKYDQHRDDIYYVLNIYEKVVGVDKDITKDSKSRKDLEEEVQVDQKEVDEIKQKRLEYYNKLREEIRDYIIKRRSENKPYKIIVTYDSFYLVKGILRDLSKVILNLLRDEPQYVVDEFQSIFTDATFKSSTENDFLTALKGLNRICFVSATPMIEKYLRLIDIFAEMPYYELDWSTDDPSRVKKPRLVVKSSKSVGYTTKIIAQSYLDGRFDTKFIKCEDGSIKSIESKEAVFYLNSVNNILSIIKSLKLTPDQVNILCADTPENQKRVKTKLGRKFSIGKIPLKGDPHKMFTFCTRTVYLGADFYSTCARSFILSDANIDTLAVDISLDLPQILGRQRLIENPWKDEAEFYYKPTCSAKVITQEQLDDHIKEKLDRTQKLLNAFDEVSNTNQPVLAVNYEIVAEVRNYRSDYVAVNKIPVSTEAGKFIKKPVLNNLVIISERRAFEIQQIDYKDRFNVFSSIESNDLAFDYQDEVIDFFSTFDSFKYLSDKLKYFCECSCSNAVKDIIYNQITEKHFHEYVDILGQDRLKSLGYNLTLINRELSIISFDKTKLVDTIYSTFETGFRYSRSFIKDKLRDIYTDLGYEKSPVASDLEEYFELKVTKVKDDTGKFVNGYELLNKKL